jgi:hypothetical protein
MARRLILLICTLSLSCVNNGNKERSCIGGGFLCGRSFGDTSPPATSAEACVLEEAAYHRLEAILAEVEDAAARGELDAADYPALRASITRAAQALARFRQVRLHAAANVRTEAAIAVACRTIVERQPTAAAGNAAAARMLPWVLVAVVAAAI